MRQENRQAIVSLLQDTDYTVDRHNVEVSLHNENARNDMRLSRYINNTYVNVVHDCEHICTQVVLSDNAQFMSTADDRAYGTRCARVLNALPHSPTISALIGERQQIAAATTVTPTSTTDDAEQRRIDRIATFTLTGVVIIGIIVATVMTCLKKLCVFSDNTKGSNARGVCAVTRGMRRITQSSPAEALLSRNAQGDSTEEASTTV